MRKTAVAVLGWVFAWGSALIAQSVAGPWQGTLQLPNNGPKLRCRLDVASSDNKLTAKFYSIDQTPSPLAVSAIAVANGELHFTIPVLGAAYTGKLSGDGQTATGTFQQGGQPLPLELKHMTAETAWPLPAPVQAVKLMDPKADPAFEVATIKPTAPDEKRKMLTLQGTRLVVVNMGLIDLLSFAYDLQPKQFLGAPGWVTTDMFDVTAVPDTEGQPNIQQMKSMIRKLAADRFAFRFHEEKREMAVYALTVAKAGPKLTHSVAPGANPGFGMQGIGKLAVQNASMDEFSAFLQSVVVDRPVANQTALEGRWDFQVNWTPDD